MAELFEVVLGGVDRKDLLSLLRELEVRSDKVSEITSSEVLDVVYGNGFDTGLVGAILACQDYLCVTARLHGFRVVSSVVLPLILLRVVKYKDGIDVSLCFDDAGMIDIDEVMLCMQACVGRLAKKNSLEEFYGGMEPASDVGTRYFTNYSMGPLEKR